MNMVDTSLNVGTMSTAMTQPLARLASAENFGDPHFRCLGIGADGNSYIFQPSNVSQIIELSNSAMKGAALYRLAPLHWWELEFPGKKEGVNWNEAVNGCVQACLAMGVFDPKRVIGRGVMLEPGTLKPIAHLGNCIVVDGEALSPGQRDSAIFVTRPAINIPISKPLAVPQAKRVLELIERLDFVEPDMARLLAGAAVIAPLCGMLDWRPHVWVIGPPGSGKTQAVSGIIGGLLGDLCLKAAGSITEAGVRQSLGPDALPVLIDEAEAKDDDSARRIASILELARASASRGGAEIRKGSASGRSVSYHVRSMFIFSSVDPSFSQTADESRIVKIELKAPPHQASEAEKANRVANFVSMQNELKEMIDAGWGHRLFWRSIELVNFIRLNAQDIGQEIAARTGNGRLGDVLGPLLAGWYSLTSNGRIPPGEAASMIEGWNWLQPALSRASVEPDHSKALRHLLEYQIAMDHGRRRSVSELIERADADGPHDDTANEVLRRHGFKVDGGRLLICRNSGPIRAMFAGTQWRADPIRTISSHPSAVTTPNPIWFGKGIKQRAVSIPLDDL